MEQIIKQPKEKEVKTSYSKEVLEILSDVWIKEKIAKCHILREKLGLKNGSNVYVVEQALKMYIAQKERVIKNKAKREEKKGLKLGVEDGR